MRALWLGQAAAGWMIVRMFFSYVHSTPNHRVSGWRSACCGRGETQRTDRLNAHRSFGFDSAAFTILFSNTNVLAPYFMQPRGVTANLFSWVIPWKNRRVFLSDFFIKTLMPFPCKHRIFDGFLRTSRPKPDRNPAIHSTKLREEAAPQKGWLWPVRTQTAEFDRPF